MRRHILLSTLCVLVFSTATVFADSTHYLIDFTTTNGADPATGSFDYDSTTQLLTNFVFSWDGHGFTGALLLHENGIVPCATGLSDGAAEFALLSGNCVSNEPGAVSRWDLNYAASDVLVFELYSGTPGTNAGPGNNIGIDQYFGHLCAPVSDPCPGNVGPRFFLPVGQWTIEAAPPVPTPEPATLPILLLAIPPVIYEGLSRRRKKPQPQA